MLPDAVPIGVRRAGKIKLNVPPEYVISAADEVIILAEDDRLDLVRQRYDLGPYSPYDSMPEKPLHPEKLLLAGWRRDVTDMMSLLDRMVAHGTELHIMCEVPVDVRNEQIQELGLDLGRLNNITVVHHQGNTALRRHLELLPVEEFSAVMITADEAHEMDILHADSHSLASLLLLRGMQAVRRKADASMGASEGTPKYLRPNFTEDHSFVAEKVHTATDYEQGVKGVSLWDEARAAAPQPSGLARNPPQGGRTPCPWQVGSLVVPIVCEVVDARTQQTICGSEKVSAVSDFILTSDITSKLLAMITEEPGVKPLVDGLLSSSGSQFMVVPSERYILPGVQVRPSPCRPPCPPMLSALLRGGAHADARPLHPQASYWELARHTLFRGGSLCGYLSCGPGSTVPDELTINPRDKHLRRTWDRTSLVIIAADHRLQPTADEKVKEEAKRFANEMLSPRSRGSAAGGDRAGSYAANGGGADSGGFVGGYNDGPPR